MFSFGTILEIEETAIVWHPTGWESSRESEPRNNLLFVSVLDPLGSEL
jgi:hypothetical protein